MRENPAVEHEKHATSRTRNSANGLLPICVDLDGTLVKTDTLIEGCIGLLRTNVLLAFALPYWLVRGRAHLKREVATRFVPDARILPYNQRFLQFLRAERSAGRFLVLATAADESIARRVADHLGCFDEVVASDGKTNRRSAAKRIALTARFGARAFRYAGNARDDLSVWRESAAAILVNAPASILAALQRDDVLIERVFNERPNQLTAFFRALRLHQWSKNLLLFAAIALAHKILDLPKLLAVAASFLAFGLCASSVYLTNDLLDLEADRRHPAKRDRPLAAGDFPAVVAIAAIPLLLAGAFALARRVPQPFSTLLATYLVLTLAYSFYLRRIALVDVLLLAGLYTIRIIAGGAAAAVAISHWLLGFSIFFFLSLALVKRYSELAALKLQNAQAIGDRGYRVSDLEQVSSFGTSSGYLAILVLALYLNSPEVRVLYRNPVWLWLLCPIMIYWISRLWLIAHRGQLQEDPVVFTLKDRLSYLLGLLCAGVLLIAA